MAKTTTQDTPTPTTDDTTVSAEEALYGVTVALDDGRVTFTRPGIEDRSFTVKDGKISTTKDGQEWLIRNVVGAVPTE